MLKKGVTWGESAKCSREMGVGMGWVKEKAKRGSTNRAWNAVNLSLQVLTGKSGGCSQNGALSIGKKFRRETTRISDKNSWYRESTAILQVSKSSASNLGV